jgi:Flp pilus assembly protein TadD
VGQVHDTAGRMRIAGLLLQYGSAHQAAKVYAEIAKENSGDAHAYVGLGTAELAEDDYAAARTAFGEALR